MRICIAMLMLILPPLAVQADAGESDCVLMRFTYNEGTSPSGTYIDRDGVVRHDGGDNNTTQIQEKKDVLGVSAEQAARTPRWTPGPGKGPPPLSRRVARKLAVPSIIWRIPGRYKSARLSLRSYRCRGKDHWYYLVSHGTWPLVAILMDGTVVEPKTIK